MFWTHCCHCGFKISKSAPGTKSLLICPKCGFELEVSVDKTAVKVTVLKMKEPRRAVMAQ